MCNKGGGSAPAAPVLPPPPELPANPQSADTESIFRTLSGFYKEDGTLDKEAVKAFSQKLQDRVSSQQEISDKAMKFLGTLLNVSPTPFDLANNDIASEEQARYLRALKGDVPTSPALDQAKAQQFQILKESAGQRGIMITGDTPETATSESTAGIRLVSEFNKRFDALREQQVNDELNRGGVQNLQRIGLLSNLETTKFNEAASLSDLANPGFNTQLGFLGNVQDLTDADIQRIYTNKVAASNVNNQNILNSYQAAVQNYQAAQARRQGFFQSLGQLGGLGGAGLIAYGHPVVGAGVLAGTALMGALQ